MELLPDVLWLHFFLTLWKMVNRGFCHTSQSLALYPCNDISPAYVKGDDLAMDLPRHLPKHQYQFLGYPQFPQPWFPAGLLRLGSGSLLMAPDKYFSGLSVLNTKPHNFKLSWPYNPNMMPRLSLLASLVANNKSL